MDELSGVCVPIEYCLRVKLLISLPETETAREPVEHRDDHGKVGASVLRSSEDKTSLFQPVKVGRNRLSELCDQIGIVVSTGDAAEAASLNPLVSQRRTGCGKGEHIPDAHDLIVAGCVAGIVGTGEDTVGAVDAIPTIYKT